MPWPNGDPKKCPQCGTTKPRDEYYKRKDGGTASWCICCQRAKSRAYYRDGDQRYILTKKAATRMRLYGVSQEQVDSMLERQGGKCAVCGGIPNHIDHDHATKKVRGLLCSNCNLGLGHFKDNPVILEKAIGYLNAVA